MSELSNFIVNTLNPQLFYRIEIAFPQMDFKQDRGGWRSRHKLDGSMGDRPDKTVIKTKVPFRALEQSPNHENVSLIELYQNLNGLPRRIDAIKALSDLLGLKMPEYGNDEEYKAYMDRQDRLERIAHRLKAALHENQGEAVLQYLKDNRKYPDEFIEFGEFGAITPSMSDEIKELSDLFTYKNKAGEEITLPYGIGTIYNMVLPYRNCGRIQGFVFRTILPEEKRQRKDGSFYPKYKDAFISAAASKRYHLFGLTGLTLTGNADKDREIIIVEGEIDALRASFAGVANVVAASGGNIYPEALAEAKSRGVTRIKLLFDNDVAKVKPGMSDEEIAAAQKQKDKETAEHIETAINTIYEAGLTPFVGELPPTYTDQGKRLKTDVDSYLRDHTPDELKSVLNDADPGAFYRYNKIVETLHSPVSWTDLDTFKHKVIALCNNKHTEPVYRDRILTAAADITNGEITKESLKEEADAIKIAEDQTRQKAATVSLVADALNLANAGKVKETYDLLFGKLPELRDISRDVEFGDLLHIPTKAEREARYKDKPMGIPTKYLFKAKHEEWELKLPSGALTYICAPTSHGKTRMLENLALRLATNGEDGSVVIFSYEEDCSAIEQQLLNIYAATTISYNNLDSIKAYYSGSGTKFFNNKFSGNWNTFFEREKEFDKILEDGKIRTYYVDYSSEDLISAIKYLYKQIKVKAVFIDYVQHLRKKGSKLQRKDELKEICKDLMDASVATKLPIILAAQLNREALSPIEMQPQNIAEASDIEHSANIVMLLWNSTTPPLSGGSKESKYFIKSKGERKLSDEAKQIAEMGFNIGTPGKLYAILAKNRGGEKNIKAVFDFNENTGVIGLSPIALIPKKKEGEEDKDNKPDNNSSAKDKKDELPDIPPDLDNTLPF